MRWSRTILALCAAFVLICVGASAPAFAAGAVTLTNPAPGGLITAGQPTFAGTDTASTGTVVVNVYSGTSTSGLPIDFASTQASGGSFTTSLTLPLADGTYTAVATDAAVGSSAADTFFVFNAQPPISLQPPSAASLATPNPILTGTALTASGDAASVTAIVYPGTSTDATPIETMSGPVASGGLYTIAASPGLQNGTYTAVVAQSTGNGTVFSNSETFTVLAGPPNLTLTSPLGLGATLPQSAVTFTGGAGVQPDDAGFVYVALYAGRGVAGTLVGSHTTPVVDGNWTYSWPSLLRTGVYTVAIGQASGSSGTTEVTQSFTVAPSAALSGTVRLTSSGSVVATVTCLAGPAPCAGNLLIDSTRSARPQPGGPIGPLQLVFQHFSGRGGQSITITRRLPKAILAALKASGRQRLAATVSYIAVGTLQRVTTTTAPVSLRR